jgi:hypothetical protein
MCIYEKYLDKNIRNKIVQINESKLGLENKKDKNILLRDENE